MYTLNHHCVYTHYTNTHPTSTHSTSCSTPQHCEPGTWLFYAFNVSDRDYQVEVGIDEEDTQEGGVAVWKCTGGGNVLVGTHW